MEKPSVSVIIPNYNHAQYLEERINSVLRQTYKDFELIILDDCSTDNSSEVIEKYRENPHVSFIVYNQQNSGSTFKQWDKGISLAKGDYIWIAESDDSCKDCFLERAISQFKANKNVAVVFAYSFSFNANGEVTGGIRPAGDSIVWDGKRFIRERMFRGTAITNASMAVFSRKCALSIGKDYQACIGAGDYLFWVNMAETGAVVELREPLNFCRKHAMNVTKKRDADGTNAIERRRIFDLMNAKGYIPKEKIPYIYALNRLDIFKKCANLTADEKDRLLSLWSGEIADDRIRMVIRKEKTLKSIRKIPFKLRHGLFYMKKFLYQKIAGKSNNDVIKLLYN